MRDEAQAAVRELEEATGVPVLVNGDASLSTMATIKPAKGVAPAHILKYHPKYSAWADYLIAVQCGYALRMFRAPVSDRFELVVTDQGRQAVGRLLDDHSKLPAQAATGLRDQLFNGLMAQLRSMPIALRVDSWVRKEYPGLHDQQDEAARSQLAENQQTLDPRLKQIVPRVIHEASLGMNAAFAMYWGQMLSDLTVVVPYRVAGILSIGEKLLRLAAEIPDAPANDKHLVEAWGELIGVTGWFHLKPIGE